jgi:hypothetical protein
VREGDKAKKKKKVEKDCSDLTKKGRRVKNFR